MKTALAGFVFLLLALVALEGIASFFPSAFSSFESLVVQYGLVGTFALIFLGSSLIPFPVDIVFTYSAVLSTDLLLLIVVAVVASFLGSLVNYAIALLLREKFVLRFVKEKDLEQARKTVDAYGPWAIIVFGVLPASPLIDPLTFLAGLSKMSFKKFVVFLFASKVIHFALLAGLANLFSLG